MSSMWKTEMRLWPVRIVAPCGCWYDVMMPWPVSVYVAEVPKKKPRPPEVDVGMLN